ncbi:MAG: N-acetylmuramoyl-L-alanine amidase [Ruminococcaceae bacterium]|nr:N-acetylmuramoyl-L-alanine amidase [Oscillospiraceae bacterium]
MDNRRPMSVQQQQAYAYERQRRMQLIQQEKIKKRKRKRFIRKCILLVCMLIILAFAIAIVAGIVGVIVKAVSGAAKDPYEGLPYDRPQLVYLPEPPEPEYVIKTAPDEPYPGYPYIDYYYAADQVLPEPYSSANYEFYKNWEKDNPLMTLENGKTIVIDAGHQVGSRMSAVWLSPYVDPARTDSKDHWIMQSLLEIGTKGTTTGIMEYVVTHQVAEKLKTALEKEGYEVILSHPDVNAQISGAERAAVANKNDADLMISLHIDAYKDATARGCTAYYAELWDGYVSERLSYLSEEFAKILVEEYSLATEFPSRGAKPMTRASMFAFCKVPIVLFEMGYMSYPKEDKLMCDSSFQDTMVQGFVNGINKYFELLWD